MFILFIVYFVYLKRSPLADAKTTASLPGVQTIIFNRAQQALQSQVNIKIYKNERKTLYSHVSHNPTTLK